MFVSQFRSSFFLCQRTNRISGHGPLGNPCDHVSPRPCTPVPDWISYLDGLVYWGLTPEQQPGSYLDGVCSLLVQL